MRQKLGLLLTAVLILSSYFGVLADTHTGSGPSFSDNEEVDVIGDYITEEEKVYSVDIIWGDMEFKYKENKNLIWNPDKHAYKSTSSGKWTYKGNDVSIVNYSNDEINVDIGFSATNNSKVKGNFHSTNTVSSDKVVESMKIKSAEGYSVSNPPSEKAYLHISGKPSNTWKVNKNKELGQITLTLTSASS
ncbi:MAG: hypothetical protein E7262_01900 [Lachnospiraceae bacterium]|nr:hypothetical protein [Lachnospiraceae bacterium]